MDSIKCLINKYSSMLDNLKVKETNCFSLMEEVVSKEDNRVRKTLIEGNMSIINNGKKNVVAHIIVDGVKDSEIIN